MRHEMKRVKRAYLKVYNLRLGVKVPHQTLRAPDRLYARLLPPGGRQSDVDAPLLHIA